MNLLEQNRPSKKTLAWVGGAHVLLLLIVFMLPGFFHSEPETKYIQMVSLGNPDAADGNPDSTDTDSGASSAKGGIQGMTPPSSRPPTPVAPPSRVEPVQETPRPPVPPVQQVKEPAIEAIKPPVQKIETIKPPVQKVEIAKPTPEPVKTVTPKETVKPADKPAPTRVKADLTKVVNKSNTTSSTATTQTGTSKAAGVSASGLTASDVEGKLRAKFGSGTGEGSGNGNGNAGIPKGTGQGALGDPSGTGHAPWYDTYIGIQLKKNWNHPASNGKLITSVQVRILGDGTVQYIRITKSSGDAAMDQSVIDAVQSVQKLGNPPPAILPSPYDRVVQFEL